MNRRRLIILGVVAALVAVWEILLFPSSTTRYRLTIDVAVGDEIKSGSGVIEMIWHNQANNPLTEGRPWSLEFRGEAIPVDLGARGRFFALLANSSTPRRGLRRRGGPNWAPIEAFAPDLGIGEMKSSVLYGLVWRRDVADLAPDLLPMLVHFRDINDPKTVEELDPGGLTAVFGPDVRIVRATVQMVSAGAWPFNRSNVPFPELLFGEPVTTGIEKEFPPWYAALEQSTRLRHQDVSLAGATLMHFPNEALSNTLTTSYFQQGI